MLHDASPLIKKIFWIVVVVLLVGGIGISAISSLKSPSLTVSPINSSEETSTDESSSDDDQVVDKMEAEIQIEFLQNRSYQTNALEIVDTLSPGSNYQRYYATYQSDDLKQYGLLTVPNGEPAEGGWPAIIFNHGYINPSVYKTTERYVAYVDYLARNGYVVFRPDYRGHDQSEGVAQGGYANSDYLIDVLNAYNAVAQLENVNHNKMGMWGHSMGGWITHRAMVINPSIKVGVIWAGVVGGYDDLLEVWRPNSNPTNWATPDPSNPRRRWRVYLVETFGTPDTNPEFWQSISAITYLDQMSGPVQIHHGMADASVPVELAERYAAALESAGKEHELYIYQDDDHNLSGNFSLAMKRTVEYFDRYLK